MCGSSLKWCSEDDEAATVGNVVGKSREFRGRYFRPFSQRQRVSEPSADALACFLARDVVKLHETPTDAPRSSSCPLRWATVCTSEPNRSSDSFSEYDTPPPSVRLFSRTI